MRVCHKFDARMGHSYLWNTHFHRIEFCALNAFLELRLLLLPSIHVLLIDIQGGPKLRNSVRAFAYLNLCFASFLMNRLHAYIIASLMYIFRYAIGSIAKLTLIHRVVVRNISKVLVIFANMVHILIERHGVSRTNPGKRPCERHNPFQRELNMNEYFTYPGKRPHTLMSAHWSS